MISQEEFQVQREALSTRQPEGEETEADDMLFQMDEQAPLQPPMSPSQPKVAEGSFVSEGSGAMTEGSVSTSSAFEDQPRKTTPPSSPLRFYPLPDKSDSSAAKDKVCVCGCECGVMLVVFVVFLL